MNIPRLYGRRRGAPAEPGPSVEHVHSIDRSSWRGAALPLGLLLAIAIAVLGGRALVHRRGVTRPVSDTGHVARRPVAPGALRPRSATSVLVLNGSGISGAAGGVSSRLLTDGYRSAPTANAQVMTYARSVVLFLPGWEREANRLAKDAHIGAVAPLDGRLPAAGSGDRLVAIIGP
jgi:hypothetical protein